MRLDTGDATYSLEQAMETDMQTNPVETSLGFVRVMTLKFSTRIVLTRHLDVTVRKGIYTLIKVDMVLHYHHFTVVGERFAGRARIKIKAVTPK